ncbi:MAG: DnaJ domain-containing protein [Spirulina sp.]
MSENPSYYEILNISPHATPEEIKKVFRRLARQYHPDFNPNNPEAAEQFKRILEAYEVLSDAQRRQTYDRQLGLHREREDSKESANEWDFYVRGLEKAIQKDYQGAIACYDRAITLNPNFLEAYLKRGEVYYTLKDDRWVLENCRQILQIFPNCAEAYFYQGRSRYRLGAVQSAIDAYDRAIGCDPNFAAAYYYRGIANHDLREHFPTERDLERAAELFQQQGDRSGYQLAKDTLFRIQQKDWRHEFRGKIAGMKRIFALAWGIIINPSDGGVNAFAHLRSGDAIVASVLCGAIANIAFLLGMYWGWQDLMRFSLFPSILVGIIPWISLAVSVFILRFLFHIRSHFSADLFLSGITVLPLGFLALTSGISSRLGSTVMFALTLFVGSHLLLTLYNSLVKISGFSEAIAAWCVPISLLCSGWLTFIGFKILMSY